MIGDPFLNYFALSGNDRNRDLPRHHAISDVRFGISIAQSRQSAFGQLRTFGRGCRRSDLGPEAAKPAGTKRQISTTSAMLPQPVVLPHRDSIHRCIY